MERTALGQFAKGRVMTEEEKLKASRALSAAAKRKSNYIGDIKEKYPRVFNSWRSIRFTKKGKYSGIAEEWKSFRVFYNDVIPTYKPGLVLRRKNTLLPWSKDNFVWVTMEEAGAMKTGITLTYKGETHTLKEWAEIAECTLASIKIRYYRREERHYSIEEIIFGRKTQRGAKPARDYTPKNIRAKASKMISSYKIKDRKNSCTECDITVDWMIEHILKKPCIYCGDVHRVGCDRIDNTKGHTKDNVIPCCVECNTARNNYFTYSEMLELGKAIARIKKKRKTQ